MGACICRTKIENDHGSATYLNSPTEHSSLLSETIDKLVNETLQIIGTIIDNDPEPPNSILRLHNITENPTGWIELIYSLRRNVPIDHPMGPSVIGLLLDDSPLPTKYSVLKIAEMTRQLSHCSLQENRNFCVILGCLAEKLAGPNSIALLNDAILDYLINNVLGNVDYNIKLLSIIAIEKFAQTSENKAIIKKKLCKLRQNPFLVLEKHASNDDFLLRQIGFCARWSLDNYFTTEDRQFSYQTVDMSNINTILNSSDASKYLKISPDGLEARCDAFTFESVRCTYQICNGCWYYEVLIITPGVMQIGWATKESRYLSDDGYGIGDDEFSIGFDGCRKLIWHNAKSIPHSLPSWKPGSILGCLIDFNHCEVIFSLDGQTTDSYKYLLQNPGMGLFAAASFMSFQQCRFNFGLECFRYPPKRQFQSFNDCGILNAEDKIVLPKHIYLDNLRKVSFEEDSCTLCFDEKATVTLEPCKHKGFCATCVQQLKTCPICRAEIIFNTNSIKIHEQHIELRNDRSNT